MQAEWRRSSSFERATWLIRRTEDNENGEYRAAEAVLNSATLPPDRTRRLLNAHRCAHGQRTSREAFQPGALLCFASCSANRLAVVMVALALLTGALAAAPAYAAVAQS